MRRRSILVLVIAGALVLVGVAQARLPRSARELRAARIHHRPLPARTQLHLSKLTIAYATDTLRFLRSHPHAGTYRQRAIVAHNHSWLLKFGGHEKRVALSRLSAARAAAALAALPPHYNSWLCIHGGEGAWNANTGNGFYGGLQMDWAFMAAYGRWLLYPHGPTHTAVTADRWTPLQQMWVAEHALQAGRGFYPWPNTARACGLI